MTALGVILAITAFFALLLSFSIVIYVDIREHARISIGAFGYRRRLEFSDGQQASDVKGKKNGKEKSTKKGGGLDKKARQLSEKKPGRESVGDTVEFILLLVKSMLPETGDLISHLRFTAVRVDVTVAGEEADRVAIEYGAVSASIYNLLAAIDQACILKVKTVDIRPDFVTGESVYLISFKAKLRLARILRNGLRMFFKYLVNIVQGRKSGEGKPAGSGISRPSAEAGVKSNQKKE